MRPLDGSTTEAAKAFIIGETRKMEAITYCPWYVDLYHDKSDKKCGKGFSKHNLKQSLAISQKDLKSKNHAVY